LSHNVVIYLCVGEDGQQASGGGGGGGGSGGAILLTAGGVIVNDGILDVSGGNGGFGGLGNDYFTDGSNDGTIDGVPGLSVDSAYIVVNITVPDTNSSVPGATRTISVRRPRTVNNGVDTVSYGGGGGGGGRIAIYAESVVNNAQIIVSGGQCGVLRQATNTSVAILTVQMKVIDNVYGVKLDDLRLQTVAAEMINATVTPMFIQAVGTVNRTVLPHRPNLWGSYNKATNSPKANSSLVSVITLEVTIGAGMHVRGGLANISYPAATGSPAADVADAAALFEAAIAVNVGLNLAAVTLVDAIVTAVNFTTISPIQEFHTSCTNSGAPGTYFSEATMTTSMYVRETNAAESTGRALFFSNNEVTNTSSGSLREAPLSWNGPIMPFQPSQPQVPNYLTI
jgi:hypothetical protein